MESLGDLVRAARERLGMDQAELGRRLKVGQQTVSRWERGTSRPRLAMLPDLAEALEVPLDDLRAAAGRLDRVSGVATEAQASGPFYVRALPFQDLSWERFEDACADILQHMYPGSHVSRFGGQGERQDGIDLLADEPREATAQCKRHKRFGPNQVRDAVNAVAEPARRNYLFVSRQTATAEARREMAKHPDWALWDGEDLSGYVRTEMDPERAIRFVDTHFPNSRQAFLGRETPGPLGNDSWVLRPDHRRTGFSPMTGPLSAEASNSERSVGRSKTDVSRSRC